MSVPTENEVRSWTPDERANIARLLDQLVERPAENSGVVRRRRLSIVASAVGALGMLPWIGYLASSLPLAESGGAWRVAWVGFDVMLARVLMLTAWLGFRRRQVAILGLLVASTMLLTMPGSMLRSRMAPLSNGGRFSVPASWRFRLRFCSQAALSQSFSERPQPSLGYGDTRGRPLRCGISTSLYPSPRPKTIEPSRRGDASDTEVCDRPLCQPSVRQIELLIH